MLVIVCRYATLGPNNLKQVYRIIARERKREKVNRRRYDADRCRAAGLQARRPNRNKELSRHIVVLSLCSSPYYPLRGHSTTLSEVGFCAVHRR